VFSSGKSLAQRHPFIRYVNHCAKGQIDRNGRKITGFYRKCALKGSLLNIFSEIFLLESKKNLFLRHKYSPILSI
jgi:hypothetical protein